MNIFVNMSVMRLSSEPDSILQNNKMTEVLTSFKLAEYQQVQIIRSPAVAKEALEANEAVFPISPVRRRAVGDDVGDVLNTEYEFLLPGYFDFEFRWKGAFREL